jgi:hypothetical protein
MDRCNDLCTKEATGTCAHCDALAERDRFERFWFKGGLFLDCRDWLIARLRDQYRWIFDVAARHRRRDWLIARLRDQSKAPGYYG